ncbi:hypothetical protein DEM26_18005 [Thioclava sp. NG1]|uniref:hypothetical protein n=1 Tax=Thioclava sp. NG1 TaxID=2182426 RepID=UPI000D612BAF|nr:hypothetical protein [Thioclava sp. NG1]PWE48442.1 hypothetical protein DEM26_18005 [Thioclava sp. NG1]
MDGALNIEPTGLRILIGCETSGVMRRAFSALGHEAWSCDLLPADDGSNHHIRGDVRDHLDNGWDMLIVAHPPCTRLCNSGVRWLHVPPPGRTVEDMWRELDEGVDLFAACWNAPIDRVAVENPVMHKHARARLPADIPRPQIVQPWWFGEPFFKATGFYLRGLPALEATNRLSPPKAGTEDHKRWSAVHRAPPGPDRWKFRSRTFEGVAAACAEQWTAAAMEGGQRCVAF